jgi:hypothetical protein
MPETTQVTDVRRHVLGCRQLRLRQSPTYVCRRLRGLTSFPQALDATVTRLPHTYTLLCKSTSCAPIPRMCHGAGSYIRGLYQQTHGEHSKAGRGSRFAKMPRTAAEDGVLQPSSRWPAAWAQRVHRLCGTTSMYLGSLRLQNENA